MSYSVDLSPPIFYKTITGEVVEVFYEPAIPPVYYTEKECTTSENVGKLMLAMEVLSYVALFLSCLSSCKIVGLELFGALQLAFFNLADHDFLNIYLSELTAFRSLNGYNVALIEENNDSLPRRVEEIDSAAEFLNNCNVMVFVLFGLMAVGGVLFLISKFFFSGQNKILKVSLLILKQGVLTLVLFNLFNISFSAGIHWKYSNGESVISSVVMYTVLLSVVGSSILVETMTSTGYGEFKEKFKPKFPSQMYIVVYIAYRMSLGIYMAVENEYEEGSLLILAIPIMYGLFFMTNLPYVDFYQNYRAGLIFVTECSILLITNYYRSMKSTTELSVKSRLHDAALLEIGLLATCVIFSLAVIVYEIVVWAKVITPKPKL